MNDPVKMKPAGSSPWVQATPPDPPRAPGGADRVSRRRLTVSEIFRESVRVYFLPLTALGHVGRQAALWVLISIQS